MAKGLWVVLNVSNVDKSVEFYKTLGLKAGTESMGPMTWGYVNSSSVDAGLVIWDKNQIAPAQAEDTRAWLSGELGKGVMVTLGVSNARKTWEKAQGARFNVDQPLREQEWGGTEFTLVDPDGYVVNFTDKFPGATPAKRKAKPAKAKKTTSAKRKVTTKKRK